MNNENSTEDTDSPESENMAVPVFIQKESKKKDLKDGTIENASDIPLFEDSDKRGLKAAQYLRLVKLDKPGAGYKGNIPLTSTLETIAQLYGDGLYNIEACNAKHQVLRSKENIRIAVASTEPISTQKLPVTSDEKLLETIRELNRSHEVAINRAIEDARRTADESKQQSKDFVNLVKTQTDAALVRDREHMAGVNKSQQDFFGNMMMANSQMFQQTIAILTIGHQHLIESLRTTYEGSNRENSVDTLLKGILVATQLQNNGNDEPDWLKALDKGGNMLQTLVSLKGNAPLPETKPENTPATKPEKERKGPFTKTEVLEMVRLKKILNDKGISLEAMLKNARENLSENENEEKPIDEEKETEKE